MADKRRFSPTVLALFKKRCQPGPAFNGLRGTGSPVYLRQNWPVNSTRNDSSSSLPMSMAKLSTQS